MTTDHAALATLEVALKRLTALAKKKRGPSRFDARDILLAVGELAQTGQVDALQAPLERLEALLKPHREQWERALAEELELACTEHIQGVDPRFLEHPRYDFAYTIEARHRLELRLVALDQLEIEPRADLLSGVERADERLAPYLARRVPGPEST